MLIYRCDSSISCLSIPLSPFATNRAWSPCTRSIYTIKMAAKSDNQGSTLNMLKSMSMKAGSYIRDASAKTADAVNESTKSLRESKFGASAGETVSSIGTRAAEGSTYVFNVTKNTAQGVVGRFASAGIPAECAREGRDAPCPRMVSMCCTALCASGLVNEGLFTSTDDSEAAAELYREMSSCNNARLMPATVTPQIISQALKLWLFDLRPEPLLTNKLVPALTSPETPRESLRVVLAELPVANRIALFMILDTCNRIAGNAAINDTDAKALAVALSPCLLWKEGPPMPSEGSGTLRPAPEPLNPEEEAVFVRLLTYMITNFKMLQG
eukprot:jgi/Ulvmu1/5736/UM245_0004.1